jgi:hypothetical protein
MHLIYCLTVITGKLYSALTGHRYASKLRLNGVAVTPAAAQV